MFVKTSTDINRTLDLIEHEIRYTDAGQSIWDREKKEKRSPFEKMIRGRPEEDLASKEFVWYYDMDRASGVIPSEVWIQFSPDYIIVVKLHWDFNNFSLHHLGSYGIKLNDAGPYYSNYFSGSFTSNYSFEEVLKTFRKDLRDAHKMKKEDWARHDNTWEDDLEAIKKKEEEAK